MFHVMICLPDQQIWHEVSGILVFSANVWQLLV